MKTVTVHEAKTNLSRLLKEIEAGEEIVIARGKTPVAKLTAASPEDVRKPTAADVRGIWSDIGPLSAEESALLLAPLPDDIIQQMEDGAIFPSVEDE